MNFVAFLLSCFNMIKLRLLPLAQPQRLFAALMIIGGSKSTTTVTSNSSINIPKKSTLDSRPIGNYSREYSTTSSSSSQKTSTSSSSSSSSKQVKNIFNDSYLNDVFWNLSSQGPAFAINPNNVDFIQEPSDFYNSLINGIKTAKKRITFASLYLGIGKLENEMINEMILACEKNPELKVHVLLDGLRGTRLSPEKESSATLLHRLKSKFPERVTISLYHTPDLNGILKKVLPPRVNETIGVNHLKTYVFDNDLLLSGANLSKDYFTNRQDRYSWVKQSEAVSSYFDNIVSIIGSISLRLNEKGEVYLPNGTVDPVTESKEFKSVAYKKLSTLLQPNTFYSTTSGLKAISSPYDINDTVKNEDITWIFPTIQMGPFNIRQDEVVTSYIFDSVPLHSKFYITSPYFNLTNNYLQLILRGKPKLDIITCSPQANGFYGAKGISGAVPDCYAIIEKGFLEKVKNSGNQDRIKVQEYIRDKWTYHGKGLWITGQNQEDPSITLIGSPNFGSRSVEKDLEAQIILLTQNKSLQQKMKNEKEYLWKETQDANLEIFEKPDRKVSIWVKLLVYFFGNYL